MEKTQLKCVGGCSHLTIRVNITPSSALCHPIKPVFLKGFFIFPKKYFSSALKSHHKYCLRVKAIQLNELQQTQQQFVAFALVKAENLNNFDEKQSNHGKENLYSIINCPHQTKLFSNLLYIMSMIWPVPWVLHLMAEYSAVHSTQTYAHVIPYPGTKSESFSITFNIDVFNLKIIFRKEKYTT